MKKLIFIPMLLIIGCASSPKLQTSDYGRQLECVKQYPYEYQGDCYINKTINDPNYSKTVAFLENKRPKSFTAWESLLVYNETFIGAINSGNLSWQDANSLFEDALDNFRVTIDTEDKETNERNANLMAGLGQALRGEPITGLATPNTVSDYDYDWDAFYDQNYNLVWRCRGVQTGRFADNYKCAADLKIDTRWPNK